MRELLIALSLLASLSIGICSWLIAQCCQGKKLKAVCMTDRKYEQAISHSGDTTEGERSHEHTGFVLLPPPHSTSIWKTPAAVRVWRS